MARSCYSTALAPILAVCALLTVWGLCAAAPALADDEVAQFEAVTESEAVLLRWTTASETNNAGFDVQRRTEDGFEAGALSSGTYFLRVRGEGFRTTRRVVVVR